MVRGIHLMPLILCTLFACTGFGTRGDPLVIRVAGDNCFPPYEFVSPEGVFTGFNVDLMNALAIELGINIELVPMPWSQVKDALVDGRVDAIQGMKYSPERDKVFDFSDPYLTSSQAIFVRTDTVNIVTPADLKGLKVAVQKGDIAYEFLNRLGSADLVVFENQQAALEALLSGHVSAFVGNRLAGIYMTQRKMRTGDVKIVGNPIDPAPYCMAFAEGNSELRTIFNEGLKGVKKSGVYDKIYKKWFGEEIEPPATFVKRTLKLLLLCLVTLSVAALAVANWNRTLRRQVALRTRQLTETLENSFNAIVALNPDGVISLCNNAAAQTIGAGVDGFLHKHWADSPLRRFLDPALVKETLSRGKVFKDVEAKVAAGDREKVISFNLGPLPGGEGGRGAVLVYRDITDSKRLEEAEAARSKMEALATLIVGLAHEIRNPLTSVKTYAQMLPQKYDVPQFRDAIAKHIPAEIERIDSIITQLMGYAKPCKPVRSAFNVRETVEAVVEMFQFEVGKKEGRLILEVPPDVEAYADQNQVKQVLINVMLNAIDALEGPGLIRIQGFYCDYGNAVPRRVCISIEDSGKGIPKEDLGRVFEPFFTRKPGGTGLGLSVSYKLVRQNGGDLTIESEVGAGTKVKILLPASERGGGES